MSEVMVRLRANLDEVLSHNLPHDPYENVSRMINELVTLERKAAQKEVIDDPGSFGIEISNCENCERPSEDEPRENEGYW
jgi:hypothetical protein